jgi:hypothetical protein
MTYLLSPIEGYPPEEYPIEPGDTVEHVKDIGRPGKVMRIDNNLCHPTTCNVWWEDVGGDPNDRFNWDIQWTNKIVRVDA